MVSREATHRFRTPNNAKSNPEIKGRNCIFLDMTLYVTEYGTALTTILPILFLYLKTVIVTARTFEP
jgi:hypothetical protein